MKRVDGCQYLTENDCLLFEKLKDTANYKAIVTMISFG